MTSRPGAHTGWLADVGTVVPTVGRAPTGIAADVLSVVPD